MRNRLLKLFRGKNILWLIIYIIIASVMVSLVFVENKLYAEGNIVWTSGYFFSTLLKSVALGMPVGIVILVVSELLPATLIGLKIKNAEDNIADSAHNKHSGKASFVVGIIAFVLINLARIPAYLAYYPGICTYDIVSQIDQISLGEYSEHHPIWHTLFIKLGYDISYLFGCTNEEGIAIHVAMQTIFLSLAMAFAIGSVFYCLDKAYGIKRKANYIIVSLLTLIMMFFPFNQYISLSITKDVVFSACFLMMVTALFDISCMSQNSLRLGMFEIVYFIGTVGVSIFRNNAKYALVGMLLVLLVVTLIKRKKWLIKLLILTIAALVAGVVMVAGIGKALRAAPGNSREMLSVPIQQMARTMIYHGGVGIIESDDNTISEQDRILIDDFITQGAYTRYEPQLSDPVKIAVNISVWDNKKGAFARTYLGLLKDYPGEYVNAFLALNAGFLSITDVSHSNVYTSLDTGYAETYWYEDSLSYYDIYKNSRFPFLHDYMENWAVNNEYLNIPVLRYIFMPGIYLWIMIFIMLNYIRKKKWVFMFQMSFIAFFYATMLLGPGVCMRYVYPIMLVVPFMILISVFYKDKYTDEVIKNEKGS